jgi:seryl-tRNA synthetase
MWRQFLVRSRSCTHRCYGTIATSKSEFQIQPKLDYTHLAEQSAAIEQNMLQRHYDKIDMKQFANLNQQRLDLYKSLVKLRTKRNDLSLITRSANPTDRAQLVDQGKQVKHEIKQCEHQLNQTESQLLEQALMIPNTTHPNSPIGPEQNARLIKTVGVPMSSSSLKDHVALASALGILDLEQAAVASGSSFYYLQGMGAFLELALVQYAMQKAAAKGFLGVMTPDIVRTQIAYGCGFQPRRGESSQIYDIKTNSDKSEAASSLCLAGTAEIPLAGKFASRLLNEQDLPQRLVGFGHAFRTEAGGRGVETKGLYRVHQFSKVELFAVTTPEQSEAMMEEISALQEDIFTELGLCFR